MSVTVVANSMYDVIEINGYLLAKRCYVFCYTKVKSTESADLITITIGLPVIVPKQIVREWFSPLNNVQRHSMGIIMTHLSPWF